MNTGEIVERRRCSVATYIILSRFSPEAFDDPKKFKDLATEVSAKIKKQCPDINKGSKELSHSNQQI
jgi:hypothetical protein